jgi:flagellar biosynthesis/type III secretory pathway M-ring protein FliF/YscJ
LAYVRLLKKPEVIAMTLLTYAFWCHTGDCGRLIDTNEMSSAAKLGWAAVVVVLLLVVAMVVFFVIRTIRRTPDDAADQAEQAEDGEPSPGSEGRAEPPLIRP